MTESTILSSPRWQPSATIETLKNRAKIIARLRHFFDSKEFFEVQTPCLASEAIIDPHIDPIVVSLDDGRETHYLQTSPEAAMKRMMAAGATAIYQIGPVFRAGERGRFHNPEFTMLEWYRQHDSIDGGIEIVSALLHTFLPSLSLRIASYREVFEEFLTMDPILVSLDRLREAVHRFVPSYTVSPLDSRDDLLDILMSFIIQPQLRGGVIVRQYPLSQAALAKQSDSDPATADRFELFIDGVEIANGYGELLDPQQLRRRMLDENQQRLDCGKEEIAIPTLLLESMEAGLPPCSGTALGVDRLVMVLLGLSSIEECISFPWERS